MSKHTPGPWHKHDPNKEGSYICRMKNGYIKMCHWGTTKWTDIWQTTLDGEVKEWMHIPHDSQEIDNL